jgi:hypothetical protein
MDETVAKLWFKSAQHKEKEENEGGDITNKATPVHLLPIRDEE